MAFGAAEQKDPRRARQYRERVEIVQPARRLGDHIVQLPLAGQRQNAKLVSVVKDSGQIIRDCHVSGIEIARDPFKDTAEGTKHFYLSGLGNKEDVKEQNRKKIEKLGYLSNWTHLTTPLMSGER